MVRMDLDDLCELVGAPEGSKAAILTASGSAGMEAAVINLFDRKSLVVAVDGGTFGKRFVRICQAHQIPCETLILDAGRSLTEAHLEGVCHRSPTGLLLCAHETSTGQAYDLDLAGRYCRRRDMLLVVDAISSILADPIDMTGQSIDALIFSANKGMALLPGLAFIVFSPKALSRITRPDCFYLDLSQYFESANRGHTPFTSATAQIVMLHERLKRLEATGGATAAVERTAKLAAGFRSTIADAGLAPFSERPSNAATGILLPDGLAAQLYRSMRDKYGCYVNPPTFGFGRDIVKIGHLGCLTAADLALLADRLIDELNAAGFVRRLRDARGLRST